eukprot:4379877-Prymnesium_polylepis.1
MEACNICGEADGAVSPCQSCAVPRKHAHHCCMGVAHPSAEQLAPGVRACLTCLPGVIESKVLAPMAKDPGEGGSSIEELATACKVGLAATDSLNSGPRRSSRRSGSSSRPV